MVMMYKRIIAILVCCLLLITGISAENTADTTESADTSSSGVSFTPSYSYWDWVADSDNWTFIKFLYQKYLDKSEEDATKLSGGGGSTRGGGAGRRFSKSDISDLNGAYSSFVDDQDSTVLPSSSIYYKTVDSVDSITLDNLVDYTFYFGNVVYQGYTIESNKMYFEYDGTYYYCPSLSLYRDPVDDRYKIKYSKYDATYTLYDTYVGKLFCPAVDNYIKFDFETKAARDPGNGKVFFPGGYKIRKFVTYLSNNPDTPASSYSLEGNSLKFILLGNVPSATYKVTKFTYVSYSNSSSGDITTGETDYKNSNVFSNGIITDPVTGSQYKLSDGYTYDLSTRTYTDGSTSIQFGDYVITISTSTINDEGTTINNTYNYYYGTVADADDSGSGGSGGGSDTDDKPTEDNFWDWLLKKLAGGIIDLFDTIGKLIGSILTGIVNLISEVLKGLSDIPSLLGDFGTAIGSFFGWLPSEIQSVLGAGISVIILLGVIKYFLK